MDFWAHWNMDKKQKLRDHLINTANLSKEFSVEKLKKIAYFCGYYHDLGKYTDEFQKKVNDPRIKASHSDCGAYEVYKRGKIKDDIPSVIAYLMAYCISGHHTGLKNGGSKGDNEDDATLYAALKSGKNKNYGQFKNDIEQIELTQKDKDDLIALFSECKDWESQIELFAFLTKYVFSCLTDADFIDTEKFFTPEVNRKTTADFKKALAAVDAYIQGFQKETEVQKARDILQRQVWQNTEDKNMFFLNMPTGSGKTLCSIRYALDKAIRYNKKRIIYVIPYTAIIEQTAKQFEEIFGEYVPILQHHSNYDFDDANKEDETTAEKLKKGAENWDYPLIITTNIQFFQSVYGYKGRSLRKLHNIADSIIIFDEIHILPFKYLKPCLRSISYICDILNSKAVMMSATMPDYSAVFNEFADSGKIGQLIKERTAFGYFRKNKYINLKSVSRDTLFAKAEEYNSSLIVVNSRKIAKEFYLSLSQAENNCYHLSTYMMPIDRSRAIDEIKSKIGKEKITVVSTSLIEVGVDLDFEAVFRETAGLDNILQSGGRCNREGKRKDGSVFVFDLEEEINYRGDIGINANIVRSLFDEYDDISSQECVEDYYGRLLKYHKAEIEENTIAAKCSKLDAVPFRKYSEDFKMIEETSYGIVIPCEENTELIERLRFGDGSAKRALAKFTASVKYFELKNFIENGVVEEINGVSVLSNKDYYDKKIGINLNNDLLYVF